MNVTDIISALKTDQLATHTRSALLEYQGANPSDVDRVVGWMSALRTDLITLIQEIEDPEEVAMTLAINYIELKSRWIAINTKINYQNFRTGSCDSATALRGAAISQLLALVEGLLTPEDIEQITAFLAEPIRKAA